MKQREIFETNGLKIYGFSNSNIHNHDSLVLNLNDREQVIEDYKKYIRRHLNKSVNKRKIGKNFTLISVYFPANFTAISSDQNKGIPTYPWARQLEKFPKSNFFLIFFPFKIVSKCV